MIDLLRFIFCICFGTSGLPDAVGGTIGDGRKTISATGTAEKIVAAATPCSLVIITAETDNTNAIVVGGSTVVAALATRRGTPLDAGDSIILAVKDLQEVWLDCITNGEGVTFTYLP